VGPFREESINVFAEGRSAVWRREDRDDLETRFIATTADEFCALLAAEIGEL
jgi:hypothetical protein